MIMESKVSSVVEYVRYIYKILGKPKTSWPAYTSYLPIKELWESVDRDLFYLIGSASPK